MLTLTACYEVLLGRKSVVLGREMQPRGQDGTLVMAAVGVVFPWSTWPIVPMFICGFLQFPSSSQNHFQLHNGSCAVESLALICTSPGMGARDWTILQEKYRVPPQSPIPALLFKLISRHCEWNKLIGTLHLILGFSDSTTLPLNLETQSGEASRTKIVPRPHYA